MADGKSCLAVVLISRLPALQIRCSRRLLLKRLYCACIVCAAMDDVPSTAFDLL